MCIDRNQLQNKVNDYRQYKRILEETKSLLDQIETDIQELMEAENTDTLTGNDFKITWKTYFKNSFDTKTFKVAAPDIYNKYLIETSYKRFLLK